MNNMFDVPIIDLFSWLPDDIKAVLVIVLVALFALAIKRIVV